MKITLFQILALSVVANVAAQNNPKSTSPENGDRAESIRLLSERIEVKDSKRKANIEQYLLANPSAKPEYFADGTKYSMIDVVDGKPIYFATDNSSEASVIRTSRLYPGGDLGLSLEGEGLSVGVWDGGWVKADHVEFLNNGVSKVSIGDGSGANPEYHGTHVAGTVAASGVNSSAKGMAPKANLISFNWGSDLGEALGQAYDNIPESQNLDGILVSNHSYGIPLVSEAGPIPSWYPGCYNDDAAQWDGLLFLKENYIMVKSAGNAGSTSYSGGLQNGLDKLTGEAAAKNNLVVANADTQVHPVFGTIQGMTINSSSSQGPADDGRIKPDITADGTNVFSTSNAGASAYASETGTSMASPCVAGSLLLLQEHYRNLHSGTFMRAATLKGLVCHTALDETTYPGPDPRFGWGLMDTGAAATVITNSTTGQTVVLESELSTGGDYVYNFSVGSGGAVKATLSWTDPAGTSKQGQLNSATPALVNDLDLRITRNSTTFYPWKLNLADLNGGAIKGDNLVDNVERIDINVAEPGQYTLTVSHKGSLSGGSQKYSLILSGTNVILANDDYTINDVTVWPNPAREVLNVNFAQPLDNAQVSLIDMAGRVVYQSKTGSGTENFTINTSGFAKGVYMLNVNADSKTLSKKVVIE